MLNYIKLTLDFLCYDFDKYAWLISVSVLAVEVLLFIVTLIVFAVKKKSSDASYFLCLSFALIIISLYFSLEDYRLEKTLFKTFKNVYVYAIVFTLLTVIFYMIIKGISVKKQVKNTDREIGLEKLEELPPSNAVKYFNKQEVLSGYIDVGYIKSLILELKQKGLTDEDYNKIEELEIYLLRFISRQPNGEERVILSEYLSMLIKKLSLYSA